MNSVFVRHNTVFRLLTMLLVWSAEDCGIVNKSRITVTFIVDEMKTEPEIMEVSIAIVQHNPDVGELTADDLFAEATFTVSGNLYDWDLSGLGLQNLPEIFCSINASGTMDLSSNKILSLRNDFFFRDKLLLELAVPRTVG